MQISGVEIGPEHPCRFVAEISNNHNGDINLALMLIELCAKAKADFIKLQCYLPDELVALRGDGPAPDPWGSDGWSMKDLYTKAQTPHEWFPALTKRCEMLGIPWFASVFGKQSLDLLESLDCPAYKIASLDREDEPLRRMVLATMKPLIWSTPTSEPFAELWMETLTLYCPPGYPQKVFDYTSFKWADGFSYHGTSIEPLKEAVISGANMLEAHVKLPGVESELEADISITTDQVKELTRWIRAS